MALFRLTFLGACMMTIAASSAAAQAIAAECDGVTIQILPESGKRSVPSYPAISQRLREQGDTVMRLTIGNDGRTLDASVVSSSGYQRLDDAATNWARASWRWQGVSACRRSAIAQTTVTWRMLDPSK
jgi:TonB family protein